MSRRRRTSPSSAASSRRRDAPAALVKPATTTSVSRTTRRTMTSYMISCPALSTDRCYGPSGEDARGEVRRRRAHLHAAAGRVGAGEPRRRLRRGHGRVGSPDGGPEHASRSPDRQAAPRRRRHAGSGGRPAAAFPVAAEAVAGKVRVAGEMAAGGVTAAGERFLSVFDQKRGPARPCTASRRPPGRRRRPLGWSDRAAWHFALLAGAVGLAASALGGTLAGLAIGRGLLGG